MDPIFQPDGLPEYETRHGHQVNWCREWQIDQLFAENVEEPDPNSLFAAPAYDSEPSGFQSGSIRLLSASVTADSGRPTYILLIGKWDNGWSWFMPFSTYAAPATDWELLSALEPVPLQVLQVWNARSCPDEILSRSWYVTACGTDLVKKAQALYARMVSGGETLSLDLAGRVGTRIFDSSDSRMGYLRTESARLDHLTEMALQHEEAASQHEPVNVVPFVAHMPRRKEPLMLVAAGDSPDRALAIYSWQVEGTDVLVHLVELLGVPDGFTLRVEGDSSDILEGAIVFDGEASKLGLIQEGCSGSKEAPLRFSTNGLKIELVDRQSVHLVPFNP
jgi:hypothetical protein